MRVLLLAPQPFFEVRGTPLAILALVRAVTGSGHEVDLLTYPQGEPVNVPGLRHLRSLALRVGYVKAGPSLAKLVLDVPFVVEALGRMAFGKYDVVHAVEEAAHLVAPWARLLGIPLVMDIDSCIPDQLRESGFVTCGPLLWAVEAMERYALRHAAAVITVCASLTKGVKMRAPRARVFQIEDPPLVGSDPPPSDAVANLRQTLGLGPQPVVLYSGNFQPYQGVELLVDAAGRVPQVQFLFMGGEDGQVEALRARAQIVGAADRCVFTGQRPPSELPSFLALADILVSPRCQGVNTPFKVYTYLATGKPLVATRISTHTQLLDDTLAFLVEPTGYGLAEGIQEALRFPPEARARAARSRALIEREYSQERFAQKVGEAYAALRA